MTKRTSLGFAKAIGEVQNDHEHGASWLARRSAEILGAISAPSSDEESPSATAYQRLLRLQTTARSLAKVRPSMAAVANTVAQICEAIYPLPSEDSAGEAESRERLAQVHQRAEQAVASWSSASTAIFTLVRPLLGAVLYTHSRSGTVEYALTRLAQERGIGGTKVILSQSHPGDEGIALATTLAKAGVDVRLVADAACGLFVGEAEAVVIGADSVRSNGSLVNKVGTFPLALAAREARVPVYLLCETQKIAAPDFALVLEEMNASELLPTPATGVTVSNVYFDVTPYKLISRIITEKGILTRPSITAIARRAARLLALLDPFNPSYT
ncbi:MAG: translation initiation factor eIF-2B [Ktedonobacterales bacterium]